MVEKNKKVLVCDDSLLIRVQLKEFLSNYNPSIEIIEATNGVEACHKYNESQPDMVFLDIVMPRMDGIECLKKIKESNKDAKVVILSSVGNQEMLKDALKAGALNFIQKPWDEDNIKKALEMII